MSLTLADVLEVLPGLIWAGLAAFLVIRFHRPIRDDVLPRLTGVKVMGVQLDLRSDEVQKAVESVPRKDVRYPPAAGAAIVSRAERSTPVLRDAGVLWIDDNPQNNLTDRRLLHRLGVFVETVISTEDALAALSRTSSTGEGFDVIVSDLARPADPVTGEAMVERLRLAGFGNPVIYYIGHADPTRPNPAGAFGLTDRPDELLHLVMDALERRAALL